MARDRSQVPRGFSLESLRQENGKGALAPGVCFGGTREDNYAKNSHPHRTRRHPAHRRHRFHRHRRLQVLPAAHRRQRASSASPVPPEPASDLVFRTLDGQPQHLLPINHQVVFLDLWGTWCIQCVAEMPTVQALYNHYRNDPQVKFLIISRWDTPANVRRYAHRNHFDLPFYVTRDNDIPASCTSTSSPPPSSTQRTAACLQARRRRQLVRTLGHRFHRPTQIAALNIGLVAGCQPTGN